MNIYNIWADKVDGITHEEFIDKMRGFLDRLVELRYMYNYRIMRMKLGFRSMDIPEYHIMMEFESMADLDSAMTHTIKNPTTDELHVGFNQWVNKDTIQHALYRDYPD